MAMAVVAWSVLGRIGYETETISGLTLLESTSEFGFQFTYALGIYFVAFAVFIAPTA